MLNNSERVAISTKKLYELAVGKNKKSAIEPEFNRLSLKTEPTKKQKLHLRLQKLI